MYHPIILLRFAFSFSRGSPLRIDHAQRSSLPDVLFAFWRLFSTTFGSIQHLRDKHLSLWRDMACELFLLLASRSLHRCIQSPYSGLTIVGNVFLPLIVIIPFRHHLYTSIIYMLTKTPSKIYNTRNYNYDLTVARLPSEIDSFKTV